MNLNSSFAVQAVPVWGKFLTSHVLCVLQSGRDFAHPGVGQEEFGKDTRKHHKYYQWVCFVLFFQAILFYVPRYLWKTWEGGRIKMLALDMNCPVINEECKSDRKKLLVEYFANNLHTQNYYAYRFFFCELCNFINVVLQIWLMDSFLGGEFTTYGPRVIAMSELEPEQRNDPMSTVFPKVTKCEFHKFGPSGSIQKFDGLCVLPLNIVNEKIYVFLWFWFVLVALITGIALMYRMATIILPKLRFNLLRTQSRLSSLESVKTVAEKCKVGDWFVLYQLGKNIDPLIFKEFMSDLAKKLNGKDNMV
jgi:innexin